MAEPTIPFDMSTFVWSHSTLTTYDQCPYQFYRLRVARDVKKSYGQAADKGQKLHKVLEDHFKEGAPIPAHLTTYQNLADTIDAVPGVKIPELKMCMSATYEPVEWKGVWDLGPNAWGVSIADLFVYTETKPDRALVLDWKTGKYRGDDGQAGRLAAATFSNYDVDRVLAVFIYTEENKVAPYQYRREDISVFMEPTYRILTAMEWSAKNGAWPKRESGLCAWCPVLDCPNNTSLQRRKFR
jgi:hypothetical protein